MSHALRIHGTDRVALAKYLDSVKTAYHQTLGAAASTRESEIRLMRGDTEVQSPDAIAGEWMKRARELEPIIAQVEIAIFGKAHTDFDKERQRFK